MDYFYIVFAGFWFCLCMYQIAISNNNETEPKKHIALKVIGGILVFIAIIGLVRETEFYSELQSYNSYALGNAINNQLRTIFFNIALLGLGVYSISYKWTNRSVIKKILRVLLIFGIILGGYIAIDLIGSMGFMVIALALMFIIEAINPLKKKT